MEILSSQRIRFATIPCSSTPLAPSNKTIFLVHNSSRPTSPVKSALLERGYRVIHSESVQAALGIWANLPRPVDLFLADINLGRDQGVEQLVKLLQAENPRMRVLYANDLEAACPVGGQTYPKQLVAVVENCLA